MARYTLGFSAYAHDSAAALLRDGELLATAEEERFDRVKHSSAFPERAIRFCLAEARISIGQVDEFAFYWNPAREISGNLLHFTRYFPDTLQLLLGPSGGEMGFVRRILAMRSVGGELARRFGLARAPAVRYHEHHLCHAASAFYPSPFENAAILTVDGRGESTCTMLSRARAGKVEKLREIAVPHSLGHFYAAITQHLGFKPFFDEWKVMGLSAYGTSARVNEMRELVRIGGGYLFELDLSYFRFHVRGQREWVSDKFRRLFGPARVPGATPTQADFDLAFAAQKVVEEAGLFLARHLREQTGEANLCVSGGVALNCLMNRRLVAESGFENVFFMPVAGDGGTPWGAALYSYHHEQGAADRYPLKNLYLGPGYFDAEIEAALQGLPYRRCENVARETARHLAAGRIVGWFQERMEAGPRALGNRSILVDPTLPGMKDRLNARVKRREGFRPFAPAVPAEECAKYFLLPRGVDSPFMMLIGDVREEWRAKLPAVTHTDGTARVQTVTREQNARFHELLTEFGKAKGVPVLLNTSFNENEPIVCSPRDAVDCFRRAGMDVLAIGDFLVERGDAIPRGSADGSGIPA